MKDNEAAVRGAPTAVAHTGLPTSFAADRSSLSEYMLSCAAQPVTVRNTIAKAALPRGANEAASTPPEPNVPEVAGVSDSDFEEKLSDS